MLGYRVRDLSGEYVVGNNFVSWDGRDFRGGEVESGTYWVRVRPPGEKVRSMRLGVAR